MHTLVLAHLRSTLRYAKEHEDAFLRAMGEKSSEEQAKAISTKRKALEQYIKRIGELDTLFQRLYEDNVAQRITDERFLTLSSVYESEQVTLKREASTLEAELADERQTAADIERFLELVRRYTEIESLTPTLLHEFIEKIVIHAPDKSSGKRQQKVEIFYNSVGIVDIPIEEEIIAYVEDYKRKHRESLRDNRQAAEERDKPA